MKKISTVLMFMVVTAAGALAQEYQAFRVGVGLGYAMASGSGAKGGVLVTLEPGYRVTDQILLNLRIEGAIIGRGYANESGAEVDVAALASYTLNGQYYFNNNKFRPFAGAGFGTYSLASTSVAVSAGGETETAVVAAANKFGFYPRLGFDSGHFTFALDYNIVPETNGIKNNYIGIRVGGFFGGGKK
jgi:outer membrane protein W